MGDGGEHLLLLGGKLVEECLVGELLLRKYDADDGFHVFDTNHSLACTSRIKHVEHIQDIPCDAIVLLVEVRERLARNLFAVLALWQFWILFRKVASTVFSG